MILMEQTVVKLVKLCSSLRTFGFPTCFVTRNIMPLLFSIYYIKDSFGENIVYCFNFHNW